MTLEDVKRRVELLPNKLLQIHCHRDRSMYRHDCSHLRFPSPLLMEQPCVASFNRVHISQSSNQPPFSIALPSPSIYRDEKFTVLQFFISEEDLLTELSQRDHLTQ